MISKSARLGQSEALVNPYSGPGERGPFQPGQGNAPLGADQRHPLLRFGPDAYSGGSVFYNPNAGQGAPGRMLGMTPMEYLGDWRVLLGLGLLAGFAFTYYGKRRRRR